MLPTAAMPSSVGAFNDIPQQDPASLPRLPYPSTDKAHLPTAVQDCRALPGLGYGLHDPRCLCLAKLPYQSGPLHAPPERRFPLLPVLAEPTTADPWTTPACRPRRRLPFQGPAFSCSAPRGCPTYAELDHTSIDVPQLPKNPPRAG